ALLAVARPAWQVLLDGAVGAAEAGSVEDRRAAAERAVALLARIPDASSRDLYAQQVADRLRMEPATVRADVRDRLSRAARVAPTRVAVAAPEHPPPDPKPASDGAQAPPPAWEQVLGSLLLQRPSLAAILLETHRLRTEDLASPVIRRVVEIAFTVSG